VSDPKRWAEAPEVLTPAERRAFAAGRRGEDAPPIARKAVWEGLAAGLAASSATAVGSGATGVTAAVVVKHLAIGALLGAAVAGGGAVLQRASGPRPVPRAMPVASSALAPPAAVPSTGAPTAAAANGISLPAPSGVTLERSVGPAHSLAPAPSAREPAVPYGSGQASFPTSAADESDTAESRRLLAARSLLRAGRTSAALDTLAAIRADFPAGSLVQEREALTIEALLASGQRAAARARAAAFLERYPNSPHVSSVRKALK
jgi:hypothetical protein